MDNLEIDYKKAAQQLRSGEALFGKDGALAPLLERILNSALEGEMDAHLEWVVWLRITHSEWVKMIEITHQVVIVG